MFERRFHIGSNDVDPHFELKISSLFRFLQEAATEHAEVIGVGKDVTFKKGMFWVISRYSVSIFDISGTTVIFELSDSSEVLLLSKSNECLYISGVSVDKKS